jgi:DNA-binding transcriptional ArsR family regulator
LQICRRKKGESENMELEEVFSSRSRMKILKLIYQLGQLNVSDVARRLKLNYVSTSVHLKVLESEGILQERTYGRVRMYRFNEGSEKAKAVQKLLDAWDQGK